MDIIKSTDIIYSTVLETSFTCVRISFRAYETSQICDT